MALLRLARLAGTCAARLRGSQHKMTVNSIAHKDIASHMHEEAPCSRRLEVCRMDPPPFGYELKIKCMHGLFHAESYGPCSYSSVVTIQPHTAAIRLRKRWFEASSKSLSVRSLG